MTSNGSIEQIISQGLFINYVIRIGGGGGSQKMTQDDKGDGGGLGKDDGGQWQEGGDIRRTMLIEK